MFLSWKVAGPIKDRTKPFTRFAPLWSGSLPGHGVFGLAHGRILMSGMSCAPPSLHHASPFALRPYNALPPSEPP